MCSLPRINPSCNIGATHLALPETFKGWLRLTSTNGALELGESLKKNSKLLSGDSSKDILYYITPSSNSTFEDDEKVGAAELDDNCHCSSVAGQIRVYYYGSMEEDSSYLKSFAWSDTRDDRNCCILA